MEEEKTALTTDLMNIVPCNPKLMSKLMSLSNAGKRDALVRKFSNTRSIQAIACRDWNSEIDVLNHIVSLEDATMTHILARPPDILLGQMTQNVCTTLLAQQLRETGWGIQIEGVTMAAQQEQSSVCSWDKVPVEDYTRAVSLTMRGDTALSWSLSRGPITPYIGAPTRVRAKRQPLQDVESYSFSQSLLQALQLRSWVKGDEGLTALMDVLIREKTDASTEELDRRKSHVYSGSITHRLPCPTMSRGGQINSTSNMASHIQINSSTATDFAKKGEDYTICFQSVFLYGQAVTSLLYRELSCLPERLAVVLHGGCCIWQIPPEVFSLVRVTYQGVPIPTAMMHLPDTENAITIEGLPTVDVPRSYSGHMAYKFAVWIFATPSSELS